MFHRHPNDTRAPQQQQQQQHERRRRAPQPTSVFRQQQQYQYQFQQQYQSQSQPQPPRRTISEETAPVQNYNRNNKRSMDMNMHQNHTMSTSSLTLASSGSFGGEGQEQGRMHRHMRSDLEVCNSASYTSSSESSFLEGLHQQFLYDGEEDEHSVCSADDFDSDRPPIHEISCRLSPPLTLPTHSQEMYTVDKGVYHAHDAQETHQLCSHEYNGDDDDALLQLMQQEVSDGDVYYYDPEADVQDIHANRCFREGDFDFGVDHDSLDDSSSYSLSLGPSQYSEAGPHMLDWAQEDAPEEEVGAPGSGIAHVSEVKDDTMMLHPQEANTRCEYESNRNSSENENERARTAPGSRCHSFENGEPKRMFVRARSYISDGDSDNDNSNDRGNQDSETKTNHVPAKNDVQSQVVLSPKEMVMSSPTGVDGFIGVHRRSSVSMAQSKAHQGRGHWRNSSLPDWRGTVQLRSPSGELQLKHAKGPLCGPSAPPMVPSLYPVDIDNEDDVCSFLMSRASPPTRAQQQRMSRPTARRFASFSGPFNE